MKKNLAREWQRHISAAEKSGNSAKSYCRKHRLRENQYYYWRKRLKEEPQLRGSPARSRFKSVPVQPERSGESSLSIWLANGVRIEFSSEPDVEWIKALLRIL